ncbi:MAG: membrane protein insertase YidC [Calditrichaeota bacterium]|nr:membrane protein insertase YidC [Calditrichota bacterium]
MDKRFIIALILIGLILYFYNDYIRWISPPPAPVDSTEASLDTLKAAKATPLRAVEPSLSPAAGIAPMLAEFPIQTEDSAWQEKRIVVETERYRIVLTTAGAQFASLKLKPIGRYLKEAIELIPAVQGARPGYRFWTNDGLVETSALKFRLEDEFSTNDTLIQIPSGEQETFTFYHPFDSLHSLRLIYTFNGDDYVFTSALEGVNMHGIWVREYIEALWTGGLSYTEADSAQDEYYSKAYAYFAGDVLEDQDIKSEYKLNGPATGKTRWGAVRTKYFIAALLPDQAEGIGAWMESRFDSLHIGKVKPNRLGVGLRLPIADDNSITPLRIFTGPLDNELLREVDPTLTKTMNWGWAVIAPISKAILWGLKQFYALLPNYGIAVIIFSIVIKLITWPLTQASSRSMAAMQRIQPKMQSLREKYKNDQQRLNKEVMKLYKEEKINPAGGCLPLLLQLPIWFALFNILRTTIEFRQAPFVWWIDDLSMPDVLFRLPFSIPFYGDFVALLPILMAVSTYFQSKMTMTDPNQKMLLYMMPIMMLVMFNNFPSGLTLYYTLFNVWSILQYKVVPPPKPAATKMK